MFANNSLGVLNFAFPDVALVPAAPKPVPTPFPNQAFSSAHIPSVLNVIFGGGLAENLLTTGTVSSGDEAGVLLGVISKEGAGPDRPFVGSFKILIGAMFATRMTTITGQNGMVANAVGVSLTPGQVRVILLS
ncbi:DUF4150 domain-containing protein [Massilia sp. CCM 9210]|uniref:DUF4150 domain-containing protein n=1 Tax=Massilia scottii TaxID=3057166 RepID=UPI002796B03D|nr:DUF4150 domain-containing protein [Massilia sp. CCM 9210]MDQ1812073.1 DUF4150 domain-containing protein [Massilia sp. CCM 9210]